jgi:hypothetical protein
VLGELETVSDNKGYRNSATVMVIHANGRDRNCQPKYIELLMNYGRY